MASINDLQPEVDRLDQLHTDVSTSLAAIGNLIGRIDAPAEEVVDDEQAASICDLIESAYELLMHAESLVENPEACLGPDHVALLRATIAEMNGMEISSDDLRIAIATLMRPPATSDADRR